MQLTDFKALTFDCYGTLIDWETGIWTAYQPLVERIGKSLSRDEILETHARHEADQEALTPGMIYSELLGVVHSRVAKEWGTTATQEEGAVFGASVVNWPAFIDSAAALQYLKKYYKLVILSNVDRESFKGSNTRLQVEFDHIFTAQDVGSYKPNPKNFEYMLEKLAAEGIQKHEILHTAESLFHDHLPANNFGIASAWIYRRHAQEGFGATQRPASMPHYDFKFTSMAEMAKAHQEALRDKS
ncbi:haloacid dehalogenase type II [Undibacterium terreum]|uniref:Haloacid dehalogenase n=1 Tax=Undibacterium terreum TaxID=1224302 RepID=A0A916UKZ3_9BURK|nr:haloacid dehalogenase type II [Undibacterium terreum]GGC75504.1 haloacid dehalogenase [Undibacterium terreum]